MPCGYATNSRNSSARPWSPAVFQSLSRASSPTLWRTRQRWTACSELPFPSCEYFCALPADNSFLPLFCPSNARRLRTQNRKEGSSVSKLVSFSQIGKVSPPPAIKAQSSRLVVFFRRGPFGLGLSEPAAIAATKTIETLEKTRMVKLSQWRRSRRNQSQSVGFAQPKLDGLINPLIFSAAAGTDKKPSTRSHRKIALTKVPPRVTVQDLLGEDANRTRSCATMLAKR